MVAALYGFQREFRVYRSMEPYDDVQLPPDWQDKTEWIFARLMYPQHPRARFGRYYGWAKLQLAARRHQLDAGLSARRPAFRAGAAALDARAGALGRTAGESG